MSVTIHDKIEQFGKNIFGIIEARSNEKKQELTKKYELEIEKHRAEIEDKKKEILDNAAAKGERERVRLIALAKNNEHHMLISKKQQFLKQVMKALYGYAVDFTNSLEYHSYMTKNIKALLKSLKNSRKIIIYVMDKDITLCKQLIERELTEPKENFSYEIVHASQDIIGGLIAEDVENLLQIDFTLKALMDENKDTVGAAITRKFNEVSSL